MESLKKNRSIVISEVELTLDVPDKSSIPRSLPSPMLDLDSERGLFSCPLQNGAVEPVQDHNQDQGQEHLILLTSINEQTTSLLQPFSLPQSQSQFLSPSPSKNEDEVNEMLEQALILGQIALVLASSLCSGASFRSQAQAPAKGQNHTVGAQTQVLVALANMGTTLLKQFHRTGDTRDLEEAGGLHWRAVALGIGRESNGSGKEKRCEDGQREKQRVSEWDRQEYEGEDGNGRSEALVRLEQLRKLLGERGFVAQI